MAADYVSGNIFSATKAGNLSLLKEIVKNDPSSINYTEDSFGLTPLHVACQNLTTTTTLTHANFPTITRDIVELLVTSGADVSATDCYGNSPLHFLAEAGDDGEISRLLITKGAAVDATNNDCRTPLHIAARTLNPSLLTALLPNRTIGATMPGINIQEKRIIRGENVLAPTISLKLQSLMSILPQEQEYAASEAVQGPTPLHYALSAKNAVLSSSASALPEARLQVVKILISHGADPNCTDHSTGFTPLIAFANNCTNAEFYDELLRIMIDAGCDINGIGETDRTGSSNKQEDAGSVLMFAIQRGATELVRALLQVSHPVVVDTNFRNNRGRTPLHIACEMGRLDIVLLLFHYREDTYKLVSVFDNYGYTPLHEAASFGHTKIVKTLVQRSSADINLPIDVYPKSSLLHLAAQCDDVEMAKFLLEQGAYLLAHDAAAATASENAASLTMREFLNSHVQVCFLQKHVTAVKIADLKSAMPKTAASIFGKDAKVWFNENEEVDTKTELLAEVEMPPGIVIKVRKQGTELFRQILLRTRILTNLQQQIISKFSQTVNFSKITNIVKLPHVEIVDDSDVLLLCENDCLEFQCCE